MQVIYLHFGVASGTVLSQVQTSQLSCSHNRLQATEQVVNLSCTSLVYHLSRHGRCVLLRIKRFRSAVFNEPTGCQWLTTNYGWPRHSYAILGVCDWFSGRIVA